MHSKAIKFRVLALVCISLSTACTTKRTSLETKALLIGKWETVTDNEFELPYVFTDSEIECEEFVTCGPYLISDEDSLTVYGVDTITFKITFPEGENSLMLTSRDWHLRLRRKRGAKQVLYENLIWQKRTV